MTTIIKFKSSENDVYTISKKSVLQKLKELSQLKFVFFLNWTVRGNKKFEIDRIILTKLNKDKATSLLNNFKTFIVDFLTLTHNIISLI